jgi:hypothetical protein
MPGMNEWVIVVIGVLIVVGLVLVFIRALSKR